jgi:hypothetical protein
MFLWAVFQNLLRFDQDILWKKCSKFDFIKLFHSMSLLKMNVTRYKEHFYDLYGFGKMGDITQLPWD